MMIDWRVLISFPESGSAATPYQADHCPLDRVDTEEITQPNYELPPSAMADLITRPSSQIDRRPLQYVTRRSVSRFVRCAIVEPAVDFLDGGTHRSIIELAAYLEAVVGRSLADGIEVSSFVAAPSGIVVCTIATRLSRVEAFS